MGRRRKTRTHRAVNPDVEAAVSRTMIFHRGSVLKQHKQLVRDLRQMMEPLTARKLQSTQSTRLRDYVRVASSMSVSHFQMITVGENGPYWKVCRVPNGPTVTFKVLGYSLIRDVQAVQKRPIGTASIDYKVPALCVMNGFSSITPSSAAVDGKNERLCSAGEWKVITSSIQSMFPALKLSTVKLDSDVRRLVLFHKHPANDWIEVRHYVIRQRSLGKAISIDRLRKVIAGGAEGLFGQGSDTESEGEKVDDPSSLLASSVRGSKNGQQQQPRSQDDGDLAEDGEDSRNKKVALKVIEVGPRIRLKPVKIEDGICSGQVLYHRFVQKTASEIAEMDQRRSEKKARREEQERRVAEKKRIEDEKKEKKKVKFELKKKAKEQENNDDDDDDNDDDADGGGGDEEGEEDEEDEEDEFEPVDDDHIDLDDDLDEEDDDDDDDDN
eukprot:ANDGO_06333.mRNA.1 Peter Pan-like protein